MLSLLLPSLLIMFIPSTFKRPVSSWKALNLRKTLLMASSVRLKPLNCSRLPCRSEERFSRNAETDLVCRLLLEKKNNKVVFISTLQFFVFICSNDILFFEHPATTNIYTLSLHDALPIFAAVIAYYVHPVNIQTACLIMEGAEFTENIINGVERPVKAAELFAFTLRVRAGNTDVLTDAEENVRQKLRAEGVM